MVNLQLFDKKQIFTFKIREVDSRDFFASALYIFAHAKLNLNLESYSRTIRGFT